MGVWGDGIWNRQPSEDTPGVGGKRESIDVGVLGPDTLVCGRSEVLPGKLLSRLEGNTLKPNGTHKKCLHFWVWEENTTAFLNVKLKMIDTTENIY